MALALVDWTGWSAATIDGFAAQWRRLAVGDFALRGRAAAMTAPARRGALTAKFALGGTEHYRTASAALAADDDGWVVLGDCERYASRIAPGPAVSTLALFFDPRTVASAVCARTRKAHALLDDLDAGAALDGDPIPVGRRRLAYDAALAADVRAIALDGETSGLGELHALALERILDAARVAAHERGKVGAVRAATRAEIHRRLARAHDYLMTAYASRLELAELARVAAMAPHHFLRAFRDVFGVTPHRALVERRIAIAARRLSTTDEPVAAIAAAVGFATVTGFSARFRRETGLSPRALRRRERSGRRSHFSGG
jgi:AraC family transcriptional regulator